jgi:pyruvate formate lyase activating enzyme
MVVGGLQKTSLIDYPGKISCVLFLSGCNFHCPYCHNPQLVNGSVEGIEQADVLSYLKKRKDLLDGVVVSGGEPTIHKDLPVLLDQIKILGYPVKLDTNGTRPQMVRRLIENGLVDYIAMDIKSDPRNYPGCITTDHDPEAILSSIDVIRKSGLVYEFRTTCVKPIIRPNDLRAITNVIAGAMLYVLQHFRDTRVLDPEYLEVNGVVYGEEELLHLKSIIEHRVKKCIVR